jgi:acetoin:2,6-dichlorophenolindophenol oxidoreductase subunit alpha
MPMDGATCLAVLERCLLARRLEERVATLARSGELPATLHLGAGQEVAQIAALAALETSDPMLYGHRGVGYWIARGVRPEQILCDIAYRDGGTNRGKGGPMHVVDTERGVWGQTGALGGNFVVGVGMALADQYRVTGQVTIVFFGDGTANRGQFHEALNFAALRRLPILFFCENNGWALSTATAAGTSIDDIADRGRGYGIPGIVVDGRDADAVYDAVAAAAKRARSGGGPTLVEAKVDRLHAHYLGDRESYRTPDERRRAWSRDPLPRLIDAARRRCGLDDDGLEQLERRVAEQIDRAVSYMRSQPLVSTASARQGVYAAQGEAMTQGVGP